MRIVLGVLGIPLVAASLFAQSNAALMANDHYTRSHDYDLIHQRIAVSNFNWDSTSISGTVSTTLVARRPGLDSLVLDEGALLTNTAVSDRGGATLRTARHGDTLVVFPVRPMKFGDTLVFTVAYHGTVQSGNGFTWITNDGMAHRPKQLWSQGEDHNNHYWFPTYDFPNDKMTWEVVATVPAGNMAVSNGRLVSNVATGNTRTVTWRQDSPSATYLVSLIVAPLAVVHDSWQDVPVDYYVYHEDSTLARPLFHVTTDMIDTYSKLTGIKYPWAKYAETTVADFFGGMENVSATTLVDWLPDARAYQDRPWYQYLLIPHELAHQWFGDYVTTVNWANMWLNEGFAEFMPGQYWSTKLGPHAEQDYYSDEYEQYMEKEQDRSMPLASLGSNNIYPKGALVLEMLKHQLGAEPFWASVHRYLVDHAFGTASTDDLRQAVLEATGQNLDWFWDEWMYQAGHPQFDVRAAYDSAQATVTLTVKQTQRDSLKADSTGLKFTVPQVFRMPIVIRVGTARGDVTQHADLNAREQTIVISGVTSAPTMVIFDDGNNILKELSFDQPTPWLATQLSHDADLWDRGWVIQQLARRPTDPAALAALADAAEHADYPLTRAQALKALVGAPAASAMPAVIVAIKDTSSEVRAAAIGTLGRLSAPERMEMARNAFARDSSYTVRAAAVTAIIRADPAHAHDVIVEAMGTPSYRDEIQDAGLDAIVGINDTTFIGQVDGMLGAQELPAHVLAALGANGSMRALDVLTPHLNDDRAAVRQWTVNAFRVELQPEHRDLAIRRLTDALPGITHLDTKTAVTALLRQLQAASH